MLSLIVSILGTTLALWVLITENIRTQDFKGLFIPAGFGTIFILGFLNSITGTPSLSDDPLLGRTIVLMLLICWIMERHQFTCKLLVKKHG